MSTRQSVLIAVASVICLFAVLQWLVLPLADYSSGLERDISVSRQRLQEVLELGREYEQVGSRVSETGDSGMETADFSLYSFLDRLAERQGLKGSIVFMRPSTNQVSGGLEREIVRLRLRGVSMDDLVAYLYQLEDADSPVRVGDMTVRSRQGAGQGLQVDLRVSVLKG